MGRKKQKITFRHLMMHVRWLLEKISDIFEAKTTSSIGRKYGWKRGKPDYRDHMFKAATAYKNLPSKVDLRNKLIPIYDQKTTSSCTGQAICAAYNYESVKNKKTMDFYPSRLFIYYNEREMEGRVFEDCGAIIRDGMKSAAIQGICKEEMWDFIVEKVCVKPNNECYVEALNHQIIEYKRVEQDLNQIKGCLADGHPIVLGIKIFKSFESRETASTGVVNMPMAGEKCLGGHAVLCCGFSDDTQRFIFQNSWSKLWGQQGFFTIPYEYIINTKLTADLWSIKVVE